MCDKSDEFTDYYLRTWQHFILHKIHYIFIIQQFTKLQNIRKYVGYTSAGHIFDHLSWTVYQSILHIHYNIILKISCTCCGRADTHTHFSHVDASKFCLALLIHIPHTWFNMFKFYNFKMLLNVSKNNFLLRFLTFFSN